MTGETPSNVGRLFRTPGRPVPSHESVHWELVGGQGRSGSWTPSRRQERARALARFQGDLYAGIGADQAEVWRLSRGVWGQVGGQGILGSWPDGDLATQARVGLRPGLRWVNALLADEEDRYLYAGVKVGGAGAQLWRFDGQVWEQMGGLGGEGDWVSSDQDHVYALAWHEGGLMVGMQSHFTNYGLPEDAPDGEKTTDGGYDPSLGNGEIYKLKGGRWSCVAGRGRFGSWDEDHCVTWVYALCSLDGELYAAIVRHGVKGLRWIGEVWRYRSGRWAQIGGEGIHGSWQLDKNNIVTSMTSYQGKIVIGYNCQDAVNDPDRFGNVWAWDPEVEQWYSLALPVSCPDETFLPDQSSFNASAIWDGQLVIAGGCADPVGRVGYWVLSVAEERWVCLGYPSGSDQDADAQAADAYGYSMTIFEDDLMVGCKGNVGTAHLWRCRRA